MNSIISSRNNPFIRYLVALRKESSFRRGEGTFVMEGASLAGEALASGLATRLVIAERHESRPEIRSLIQDARGSKTEVVMVTDGVMKAVTDLVTSPGVMAVVRMPRWSMDEVLAKGRPIVLLCGLQDPGNMGSIIRTAEAAGAGGVFCAHGTADPYNPKVVRGSMGSILRMPMIAADDPAALLKRAGNAGYSILATGAGALESCFAADLKSPFLLLVGQESAGVPADLRNAADRTISIPMEGEVESLNAAMATGIILFEAKRQRETAG